MPDANSNQVTELRPRLYRATTAENPTPMEACNLLQGPEGIVGSRDWKRHGG